MKHLIAAGVAALLLAGCAGQGATQDVTSSATRKGGILGLSTADAVSVSTPKAFNGLDQVVIGGFTVAFATEKTQSAKAGGGLMGSGFGGKSTARATLQGVSDGTMQKITDAAYADFVKTLEAQGVKVADRAALLNHPDFAKTNRLENPHIASQGGIFGGKGSTRYFAPSSFGAIHPFMGDVAGESGGFGFSNPTMGAVGFADKTGRKVIHVVYLVDFANADAYGGWHTNTSSISVGQGISIAPEGTKLGLIGGQMGTFSTANGAISLGQPINSDQHFATVTDATGGGARAGEVAANVIGLIGGVGTNISRTYAFDADEAAYEKGAKSALHKASSAFAAEIARLK